MGAWDITQLTAASEHEWFVLVLLPELPLPPRAFVVPRDHVCAATWIRHQDWLTILRLRRGHATLI